VCVMPPPMPQQAVSLALGTTLGCGGEVVSVARGAVIARHLA
jgi:hypothetical protein